MSKVKLPVEMIKLLDKTAKANYKEAKKLFEEHQKNRVSVPEGKYHGQLSSIEPGVVNDKAVLRPKWLILDEEYKGKKLMGDTLWLHNAGGQSFLFSFLSVLGVEIPETELNSSVLSDMVEALNAAALTCILNVKDKEGSDYPEVRPYKPWTPEDGGAEAAEAGTEDTTGGDSFDTMDRSALKTFIAENALDVKVFKSMSDDDIREKLREALPTETVEPEEPEEPEQEEPEESAESVTEDLQTELAGLDRTGLKAFIKSNDLQIQVFKSMLDDDIRANIVAAVTPADGVVETSEEPEEPEAPETEEAGDPDIEELPLPALKELCKKNGYHKLIKGFDSMTRVPLVIAVKALIQKKEETSTSAGKAGVLTDKELEKFCKTQEISEVKEVVKNYKNEKVIAKIFSQYEFVGSTLADKEKKYLTRLGLGHLIVKGQ